MAEAMNSILGDLDEFIDSYFDSSPNMDSQVVNVDHNPMVLYPTPDVLYTTSIDDYDVYGGNIYQMDIDEIPAGLEVIPVDPEHEYSENDDDMWCMAESTVDQEMSTTPSTTTTSSGSPESPEAEDFYFPTNLEYSSGAVAQENAHHCRIYRKSLSLPQSPHRSTTTAELGGMYTVDDIDIPPHHAGKPFDLASYITQDENFEVIEPQKVSPPPSLLPPPPPPPQMGKRLSILSAKRMHFKPVLNDGFTTTEDESDGDDYDDDIEDEGKSDDNQKRDPTWSPSKLACVNKSSHTKIPTKVKKLEKKVAVNGGSSNNKKLQKVVKSPPTSTPASSGKGKKIIKPKDAETKKETKKETAKKEMVKKEKLEKQKSVKIPQKAPQLTKDKVHKIATKTPLVGKTVKLDHDYCHGKRQPAPPAPRKAIEIPIIDPKLDLKLLKSKTKAKPAAAAAKVVPKETVKPAAAAPLLVQKSPPPVSASPMSPSPPPSLPPPPVKRKLNLDEYKERQRRENAVPSSDHILQAGLRTIRRSELQKRAKMKQLEPKIETVSLQQILPLAETIGIEEVVPVETIQKKNFHERIFVSMSCNTEITLPPGKINDNLVQYVNDTVKKLTGCEKNPPNSSLIYCIQDSVLSKAQSPPFGAPPHTSKSPFDDAKFEHGEDRTIDHQLKEAPKNPERVSIACQTVNLDTFPPLDLQRKSVVTEENSRCGADKGRSRSRSKSKRCYRKRRRSSSSSSTSRSRSSRSSSTSSSSSSTSSSSSSSRSSSSSNSTSPERSPSSHRSQYEERNRYKRRKYSDGSESYARDSDYRSPHRQQPARRNFDNPNTRNVVYVGNLEAYITADILKHKFHSYGNIKRTSVHTKPKGIYYGFVTFETPEQAYNAIGASPKDPTLNMYDVSFGERRKFCKSAYADLDGAQHYDYAIEPRTYQNPYRAITQEPSDFGDLLASYKRMAQR